MAIVIQYGKSNQYLSSVVALAKKVYPLKDVSPLDKYQELFQKNPEAFTFAIDTITQRLVGYIIALPVSREYFERTKEADYDESDLTADQVLPYQAGQNDIYLFSIVIDPEYQNRFRALKELSSAFVYQLRQFAIVGKYVMRASAVALSDSGVKLCLGMKMAQSGVNNKGVVFFNEEFTKIYLDTETKQTIHRRLVSNKNGMGSNS